MKSVFLDFEQALEDLHAQIEQLRVVQEESAIDISEEIRQLEQKSRQLAEEIYSQLTPWQCAQVARHPQRPYTLDYISAIFTDFVELHGDRGSADDKAIICGLARLDGASCVVIGHQKGRDTKEKLYRNFGMPKPEGYRKAIRAMGIADKYSIPLFTFIDTPGAYPGIDAEERGQSEAIGHSIHAMMQLRSPLIATVIGEGGSGGALAIAIADCISMLEFATYSVISPEGCASILWKSAERASDAADAMGITAVRLHEMGLVDRVIKEPVGGAHREPVSAILAVKKVLTESLAKLNMLPEDELMRRRYERLLSHGRFKQQSLQ